MTPINFKAIPKVALHDHLDGGLRPGTLLELGREHGISLPAGTAEKLEREVAKRANSGSLVSYLEAFNWTIPVMQTAGALTRIAREAVEDLAADGVVLAEIRFAPLLHTEKGLTPQQALDAVVEGLMQGTAVTGVPAGLILCAIRCNDEFEEIAELFVANHHPESVVVGVDLAGPELGFPVSMHPAIAKLASSMPGAPITLHAGEADGVASMWEAVNAGARRIGHGTHLIDDIVADRELLNVILERGILLEVCLSSNHQTGAVGNLAAHPLKRFIAEGVLVGLDADNRLMSATCHSQEYSLAHEVFGLSESTLYAVARNGVAASFLPLSVREQVLGKYPKLR